MYLRVRVRVRVSIHVHVHDTRLFPGNIVWLKLIETQSDNDYEEKIPYYAVFQLV